MRHEQENEKINIMTVSHQPISQSLSLAENSQKQRIGRIFKLILCICIALSIIFAIVKFSRIEQGKGVLGIRSIILIIQCLILVVFYMFGAKVSDQHSEKGLKVVCIMF
ncbi:unnamed protein product [Rotaria sordida]|uniref:Uncharacterized protein n=1 Tax=Rotaria sordida TaxID=392033 RepID=A0A815IUJ4_9BILA|nr:unnamed protein product [Rotaria sordida]